MSKKPEMIGGPKKHVGEFTTLADTTLARIGAFQHGTEPHRDPDEEFFPTPSLIFTTTGTWDIRTRHGRYHAYPGTIVYGRPGDHFRCRHDLEIPDDEALFVRFFDEQPLGAFENGHARELQSSVRSLAPATRAAQELLRLIVWEAQKNVADPLKLDLLSLSLLAETASMCGEAIPPPSVDQPYDRVETAKTYLHAHYGERVDLATLAKVAGFSAFHFARVFRAHVGESPYRYLIDLRLDRAAELLRETTLPVTQICHDVGFGSLSHFITTFRRRTGKTPTQFRRQ